MILIMGLAGSGKGTQGQLLADTLGYKYLSTGEFLRTYITEERKKEMAAGNLVNDEEMIDIIKDFLETNSSDKSILDGFPRTGTQADWLAQQHDSGKINIEYLIYIDVPKEKLVERLLKRGRHDDNEQAIRKRFDEYSKSTSPIIDNYAGRGIKVIKIDGNDTVDNIHAKIIKLLEK